MELKVWLTNKEGEDLRVLHDDFDFEIGGDAGSTFQITCTEETFRDYEIGARIYVEGTEYGGVYGETHSVSIQGIVYVKGKTWRGLIEKKVVKEPSGSDHLTVNGDIQNITRTLLDSRFDGVIVGAQGSAGVSVSNMAISRTSTLMEALNKIYNSVGYRPEILYKQTDEGGYVEVKAVPQNDYADDIELSKEGKLQFTCRDIRNGVNHLKCLGKGEGTARTIIHLYADADGNISRTQTLFGIDEIEEIYDNNSAEDDQLEEDGIKRLKEQTNRVEFDATASEGVEEDISIGDIVSGADSFTGKRLRKPIGKKVIRRVGGSVTIDYEVEKDE